MKYAINSNILKNHGKDLGKGKFGRFLLVFLDFLIIELFFSKKTF
jgi:hypothetical protein